MRSAGRCECAQRAPNEYDRFEYAGSPVDYRIFAARAEARAPLVKRVTLGAPRGSQRRNVAVTI
jgi:hypothetical protein